MSLAIFLVIAILEAAGVSDDDVEGVSLLEGRPALLTEATLQAARPPFCGVRTRRLYVGYTSGEEEHYNLCRDP